MEDVLAEKWAESEQAAVAGVGAGAEKVPEKSVSEQRKAIQNTWVVCG